MLPFHKKKKKRKGDQSDSVQPGSNSSRRSTGATLDGRHCHVASYDSHFVLLNTTNGCKCITAGFQTWNVNRTSSSSRLSQKKHILENCITFSIKIEVIFWQEEAKKEHQVWTVWLSQIVLNKSDVNWWKEAKMKIKYVTNKLWINLIIMSITAHTTDTKLIRGHFFPQQA